MTPKQNEIVDYIRSSPEKKAYSGEIEVHFDLPRTTVQGRLQRMELAGILERCPAPEGVLSGGPVRIYYRVADRVK